MNDVYMIVRVIYFTWAFGLFLHLIYWGIQDILLARRCGHVQITPEGYLMATAVFGGTIVLIMSLGEIFIKDIPGGMRTFMPILLLLPGSLGARWGAFRVKMHRISVNRGLCGAGYHADSPHKHEGSQ